MIFIADAFAQGNVPAEPSVAANLLPLLLIFGIFYFLLIRPQQQKIKAQQAIIDALKKGDEVVTTGGIVGKVVKVEEGTSLLHIEIANDVVIRVNRASVISLFKKEGEKTEQEPAKKVAKKAEKKPAEKKANLKKK